MYDRPIKLLLLTRKDIVSKLTEEIRGKLDSIIRYDDNLIVELSTRAEEAEKYVEQYKELQEKYDKLNRDYKLRVKALDEMTANLFAANKKIDQLNREGARLQQELMRR